MKEKIVIKNFSVLEDIDLEINKINILIGPQASGKSLVAKLIHFFKNIVILEMIQAIISNQDKRKYDSSLKEKFNLLFPEYLTKHNEFEIEYYYGENKISISKGKDKNYKLMAISYPDKISKGFNNIKKIYNTKKESMNDPATRQQLDSDLYPQVFGLFYDERRFTYYIPALRSILIQVEKQIFSLYASGNRSLDFFLLIFGNFFQQIKANMHSREIDRDLFRLCSEALGGEFKYDGIREWINVAGNRDVLLKDSSAGQQELVPMLLALQEISTFPNYSFTFIEEPEAHIFPETQYKIVEIIARVYNLLKRNTGFFITTHSPYILTAFNNLIQAENTFQDIQKRFTQKEIDSNIKDDLLKKLHSTINQGSWINFDDVAVYLVENGKCRDIKDRETKLIDADAIDKVSDAAGTIFNQLLDISPGD